MNWLLVHTNQGVHLGLKTVDFCYQFLQAGLILSHYYILRWSQVLILNLNMVRTIFFILTAAAIAPVISLPLPTNNEPVPGPSHHRAEDTLTTPSPTPSPTHSWVHVKRSVTKINDFTVSHASQETVTQHGGARTSANSGNSAGGTSGLRLTNERVNILRLPSWVYVPYLSRIFMISHLASQPVPMHHVPDVSMPKVPPGISGVHGINWLVYLQWSINLSRILKILR